MYCKRCGAEIADDSIYCSKCGQKVIESKIEKKSDLSKKQNKIKLSKIQITIIGIFVFVFSIIMTYNHFFPNGIKSTLFRDAQNSDIKVEYHNDNYSLDLIITAQKNIKDLEITIIILDEHDNQIKEFSKYIGDLKKGEIYRKSFSTFEFSGLLRWKPKPVVDVNKGRVFIFQ